MKYRIGYWDLDVNGLPYYVGRSREQMIRTAERLARGDYRIKRTEAAGRWVSTIFLWIDHDFRGTGKPILFETAVSCGGEIVVTNRYRTRDEALKAHDQLVKEYEVKEPSPALHPSQPGDKLTDGGAPC